MVRTKKFYAHAGISLLVCGLIFSARARAEYFGDYVTVESRSKTFVVSGPPPASAQRFSPTSSKVLLEPALLAISCERIKEELYFQLGLPDSSFLNRPALGGKIFITLHRSENQRAQITSTSRASDITYRIDLPNQLEASRLVEAVVQTLVVEMASRSSDGVVHEVPRWIREGLTGIVEENVGGALIQRPNQQIVLQRSGNNPEKARQKFRHLTPLTFEELSWPENLTTEKASRFHDSAKLFVSEILELKEGHSSLRQMIADLGKFKNWQFAFLRAFPKHFEQLIDVEKWWALRVAQITGRDPSLFWPMDEAW